MQDKSTSVHSIDSYIKVQILDCLVNVGTVKKKKRFTKIFTFNFAISWLVYPFSHTAREISYLQFLSSPMSYKTVYFKCDYLVYQLRVLIYVYYLYFQKQFQERVLSTTKQMITKGQSEITIFNNHLHGKLMCIEQKYHTKRPIRISGTFSYLLIRSYVTGQRNICNCSIS